MTQLIINGIYLPETSHDRYSCYPEELGTQVDMISGRRVKEIRGNVQRISYEYDRMSDSLWRQLSAVLRAGNSFSVTYLPDDNSAMVTSVFLCDSLTSPTFAFSRYGEAMWHNVAFSLREVKPHD